MPTHLDLFSLKTLIIDNYDSYTFNLLQLCDNQANVVVIRNDQVTWTQFKQDILPHFHNIIISPGPGRPERTSDFGICTPLLEAQLDPAQSQYHRPIFGICLGHQGIAHILGAKVTYASRIMHGRMSQIHVTETQNSVFANCSLPFWAVRYHSLVVDPASLPESLKITAYCYENDDDVEALRNSKYLADGCSDNAQDDDRHHFLQRPLSLNPDGTTTNNGHGSSVRMTVMGFQHTTLPLWGVQFHPESVSTEHGVRMMRNFAIESMKWYQQRTDVHISFSVPLDPAVRAMSCTTTPTTTTAAAAAGDHEHEQISSSLATHRLLTRKMSVWVDAEHVLGQMNNTNTVGWLDSSRKGSSYSNMSVLSIDPAFTMVYSTLHRRITFQNRSGNAEWAVELTANQDYFTYISDLLSQFQLEEENKSSEAAATFCGGIIGYFGYEMKRESLAGYVTPIEQQCQQHPDANHCRCMREPDAGFQFVDRFWKFDHATQTIEACCLVKLTTAGGIGGHPYNDVGFATEEQAQSWLDEATQAVTKAATVSMTQDDSMETNTVSQQIDQESLFTPDMQHKHYVHAIDRCIHEIGQGESYELCLTTRFRCNQNQLSKRSNDLTRLYTHYLRKNNPAPYSALLRFPVCGMTLLSSSPERFLSVSTAGVAEMKPIKGTVGRALACACKDETCDGFCYIDEDEQRKQTLWQDVKERAENLMIVDLIRNDLAQVCDPSTVRVPKLMHVETYEKVHHLVSTVRGTLLPNVNSVQTVRKCFPPGSMTGAPKLRSVQLLDQLEQHRPRGAYSGCLGYFSLNGSADFNVVIRTAVVTDDPSQEGGVEVSVGGGGAITFLSDAEQEWKETLLKTRSVAPSIKEYLAHC
ncbi:ADC synthase [Zychaea mexicana]|uniref:ADC synthase n=1 Tax=Zychaea mexicana TaxID=64656 RepID=UPI0022FE9D39|nr:ADC synthase [Zychaea mexicana]KAI9484401.1 ADC synthase [Zychaea mexicana]